ncbi:hypothetical protein OSB04_010995 [Centaurea solstitialis]|uniref:SWIM-type domain-containing protein n=1 Tax=Centaurea solstitialis TaxID=347529 RepID=A0AA38TLS0_9ASTR|nr:hypothetical protein OSB04_010995 [Centaurea solstitialis]
MTRHSLLLLQDTTTSLLLHQSPFLFRILKSISPPEFLNDEDILMDFLPEKEKPTTTNNKGSSTGFYGVGSDLSYLVESVIGSTETESDEEDYLIGLTRKLRNNTLSRRFMEIRFQFQEIDYLGTSKLDTKKMSQHKLLLSIAGGGGWYQNDGGWVYSSHLANRRVWVPITTTYSNMVKNICSRFGIEPSDGVTRLSYIESGNVYILSSDEELSSFLQSVAGLDPPATLYVYDDMTAGNDTEENVEDNSNIGDDMMSGHVPQYENQHAYGHTSFDNAEILSNETYGVSSQYTSTSYVPETQQAPEEPDTEDRDEDEDEDEDGEDVEDRDPDNYVYEIPDPHARLFPGNDEFHDLPPHPRSDDTVITPTQAIRYSRREKVKLHQVFRTKSDLTLALGLKFLQEGFEFKTPKSDKKDMRQYVCKKTAIGAYMLPVSGDQLSWRAKWQAITMIEGNPEDSFTRLPLYFHNVELKNPGTQIRIVVGDDGRFVACFFALGCSIRTFRSGLLRKVLIIDGAHLKGRYSGTMFLAVAMDGNNQVVPIAIGVAKSESGEHWTWFLSMLRQCIGEMEGLVFVSDRAASIHLAINTVFPNAHHALCCRHLYMNIKAKANNIEDHNWLFWKTCKAYTARDFEFHMNALRAAVPYSEMLLQIGADKWSRAHFPGLRYNMMSSNSVESMNAHATVARKNTIVALMDYFRSYQQQWYSTRRTIAGAMNNKLTQWAELNVQRRMGKCSGWTAREIGYGKFEVNDGDRDAEVDIHNQTCTCKKWQLSGLPCGHAITVANHQGWDDCCQLASDYFSVHNLRETYAPAIYPVGPYKTWVSPDYPLMVVRPPVMKKLPGKPSNNNRIPSRGEGSNRRRCGRCRQYGHKRSQCPHVPSGSRQTPVAPTQQPDESYSRPTIDLNVDLTGNY